MWNYDFNLKNSIVLTLFLVYVTIAGSLLTTLCLTTSVLWKDETLFVYKFFVIYFSEICVNITIKSIYFFFLLRPIWFVKTSLVKTLFIKSNKKIFVKFVNIQIWTRKGDVFAILVLPHWLPAKGSKISPFVLACIVLLSTISVDPVAVEKSDKDLGDTLH